LAPQLLTLPREYRRAPIAPDFYMAQIIFDSSITDIPLAQPL